MSHFAYLSRGWWTFGLSLPYGSCGQCCCELWHACFCSNLTCSCLPYFVFHYGQNHLVEDKSNLLTSFSSLQWPSLHCRKWLTLSNMVCRPCVFWLCPFKPLSTSQSLEYSVLLRPLVSPVAFSAQPVELLWTPIYQAYSQGNCRFQPKSLFQGHLQWPPDWAQPRVLYSLTHCPCPL